MTAQQIVEAALRKLTVYAAGETPNANDLADGLLALQSMLRVWARQKLLVWASVEDTLTLTAGTASYSWGTGGNIATTRPNEVTSAFVLDSSNYSHPVSVNFAENDYTAIEDKTTQGRPDRLFLKKSYPLAYIYLYKTPNAAETLYLYSLKPFTETSSFDVLGSTISLPPEYEEPAIYNLSIRLAPEYGKAVSADIAEIARIGFDVLKSGNATNYVQPVRIGDMIPASGKSSYNINAG